MNKRTALNTAACPRCTVYPCRCAYEPRPGFKLDDADVERIAQRVVELFRRSRLPKGAV